MTVGVKYCGGCNPRYDRAKMIEQLKKDFPHLEFVRAEETCDLLIVVCGCPIRCADDQHLSGRLGKCVLSQESDDQKLWAWVEKNYEKE